MKQDEGTPQIELERLNFQTIISKSMGSLVFAALVFLIPYSSLDYLWPALGVVALTAISLFFSLKLRSTKLYVIYYLCIFMMFFLLGLRYWEFSPGLSWTLILTLVPGFALAALFPMVQRDTSEAIYRAMMKSHVTSTLITLTAGVTGLIGLILLWKLTGIEVIWDKRGIVPMVLGYMGYFATLIGLSSGSHFYASGMIQQSMDNSPQ